MTSPCRCTRSTHEARLVVVTGGPGAGKTAVLDVAQRIFCQHVVVLPESASILWTGGFPRRPTAYARECAQRAIVRVQQELERIAIGDHAAGIVLCDRGVLDGLGYWPRDEASFFAELGLDRERELARYGAVIHLRPAREDHGYPHVPGPRVENAAEAAIVDEKIAAAWEGHPNRVFVDSDDDFVAKLARALELIRAELPPCCRDG